MTETKLAFADRALAPGEADLLNRAGFVTNLVTVISNAPKGESNVFALYGKWGEGKTSTLSLMVDQFEERRNHNEAAPIIIKFNPWVFSGREKLFQAFFEDIGNTIGSSEELGGEERAKKFKKLASYTSLIGSSIKNVDSVLNLVGLSVPGSKLGEQALERISGILKTGAEAESASTQPSLEKLKATLVEDLKGADSPLLVVLDDIDRLPPPELVEIFQLLKSIADLPNVHYLILCDRENVEENLIQQGFAGTYLEKIVQFGVPLPVVPLDTLSSLLVRGISQIFEEFAPEDHRIDAKFLETIKDGILPTHFTTLRTIKRFLGDLRLSLPIHCQNGFFELNPQQYLFLTACRLLCPKGVEILASKRKTFVHEQHGIWLGTDKDRHRESLTKFIEDEFPKLLENAELIEFHKLFAELLRPLEAKMLEPDHALENRLIHSSVWFDCYFTLERPQRVISVAQAGELDKSTSNSLSDTCSVVKSITEDVGYTPLLRYLITAPPSLFCDESSNLMTALLSNEENPLCQDPESGFFESNIFESFLYWLRESPDEERKERALKVLIESKNYRFFSLCFFMLGGKVDPGGGPHRNLRRIEQPLMKATAKMIEQKAADGDDLTAHYFGDVHDLWYQWGGRPKLKNWIKTHTETDEQFIRFVASLGEFRDATHEGESGPRKSFFLRHERLASFPSLQTGIKRCKALLNDETISEDNRMILERSQMAFQTAATYRKGNKVLPKKLPEWVSPRFTIHGKLNLTSHYLFIIPCFDPSQTLISEEEREKRKEALKSKLQENHSFFGSLLIKFPSCEGKIVSYVVQAEENGIKTIANDLALDAYFILRNERQIILASAGKQGRMVLGNLSDLTDATNN